MDVRDRAYEDWVAGMKYKEIAEKYDVSLSAVKSWAARHWKTKEVATKSGKKTQPKDKKTQPKKRGAPKGNQNAKGNHGGAPLGNKNNLKHGIYANVYWDMLDEEELELVKSLDFDEEHQLEEQIALLTVRERRLMKSINHYRDITGGLAASSVIRTEDKIKFETDEEKERYDSVRREKQKEGKISYFGSPYNVATKMEATINIIQRLEGELTRVQGRKTKCIETLARIRSDRAKEGKEEKEDEYMIENKIKVELYLPDNGRDKKQ